MNQVLAAALALSLSPLASAGQFEAVQVSETDFNKVVSGAVLPMQAKNAFDGLAECRMLDNKRLYDLDEAVAALEPCLDAVARRYGVTLTVEAGPVKPAGRMGIVIYSGEVALTAPVMRDLNAGLEARGRFLLGHSVLLRREAERPVLKSGPAQADPMSRILSVSRGFATKWDQCQDHETCGSDHYCCFLSRGNRCLKNNVLCK